LAAPEPDLTPSAFTPLARTDVLLRVANLMASTEGLEKILGRVAEIVREAMGAERCNILLIDPETRTLRPGASAAPRRDQRLFETYRQMPPIPLSDDGALAGFYQEDRAVVIEDARQAGFLPRQVVDAFGLETLLLLPLRHRGSLAGLMVVEYEAGRRIDPEEVLTIEAVGRQAGMVVSHARAEEHARLASAALAERVMQQSVLLDVSLLLGTAMELDAMLQHVAESLATVLPVTYCRIALWHPARRRLEVRAGYSRRGGREVVLIGHTIDPDHSPWHAQVLKTRQPVVVNSGMALDEDQASVAGARSLLLLPMVGENRFFGIITIGEERSVARSPFSEERIDFYRTLSSQAALAIEKAELFRQREEGYWSAIHSIASVVEARDMGTHEHVYRVSSIAVELGRRLGVQGDPMRALERASILHDFGKITVPDRVLLKPGPLTPEEWEEMRSHSVVGGQLLSRIPFLAEAVPLVRHHHESWDGNGYPERLKGAAIPAGSRIIAVADTYDAMTTNRAYRSALPAERAFEEITTRAGVQFDPEVCEVFAASFADGGLARAVSSATSTPPPGQ
jgi:GAF domain-containing protein